MDKLTQTDIKDAIMDLSALIREVAQDRTPRKGKIAEIKALRARKLEFEARLTK